ncbi:MAG: 3-oxoacyl-[acyl-carrier-protein] reductase [Oscillospiraceae bacterium]|nr:3-oxoacyl-[acyl-carrier-protein] reductase [Oscillospiraceae bacterium]
MSKTALITGASQGIGAAIALRLAKDGFNIAVNYIGESGNAETVAANCREFGVEAECFLCDVSDYSACEELVKSVKVRFGSIDALVNNAGITRDGLLVRMSEEQYDSVIAVNQKSVFNMMKLVGAVMFKQKSGSIVNLSSVAGLHGNAGQMNYSASKAAVIGMTKSAAKELAPRGINVNAVAPGFVQTPMTDALSAEQKSAMLSLIAMKRYGQPEEIAGLTAFLLSPDAAYITGQVVEISGGISM